MNASTDHRSERERDFHNQWARSIDIDELLVIESFEAPTAVENRFALQKLGNLRGKRVLDLGCGAGETSVYLALQGAEVYACDIAEDFLQIAQRVAAKYGVAIHTQQCDAQNLPYPDDFFDCFFGNGILHHVELLPTAREIRRVLKPGGKGAFVEPLPYNPLVNVYRMLAREVRTEDEKPLSFSDIKRFQAEFSEGYHEEFWFATLLIFVYFFLIKRWNPSKVRYWKRVISEAKSFEKIFNPLKKFDDKLLKFLPFLKPLCWNTVLIVKG